MKIPFSYYLLSLALAWCSASWGEAPGAQATVGGDGVQHVTIDSGSYFFKPNHVIVKVNVPVELSVKTESGLAPHNFVIQAPEAGIRVDQNLSSEAKSVRFTPTTIGKYPFYCSKGVPFFKSHREKGMEGVLEVVK